jgi:hypothetical protein
VWSSVGIHRPAEFNRNHIPAYVRREEPRKYVCVYPFNRSLEWYLLPDYERRGMLAEHGIQGRDYEDVRANTVAAFGLGDYEWLLAFEADEMHRITDCLRHLRTSRRGCTPSSRRRSTAASARASRTSSSACRRGGRGKGLAGTPWQEQAARAGPAAHPRVGGPARQGAGR